MVILGFTVTHVRRRQVPNTRGFGISCRLQSQALVMFMWAQSLPCGGVLHLFWLAYPPDRLASPSTAMPQKSGLLRKLAIKCAFQCLDHVLQEIGNDNFCVKPISTQQPEKQWRQSLP